MANLTIKDIARMAGVSTTAVSFVLNNRRYKLVIRVLKNIFGLTGLRCFARGIAITSS